MPVSYRKVGSKWHIRFREGSGRRRREVTKSLPGHLHESTVRKKADWFDVEWSLGRYDPFEEKADASDLALGDALFEYCESNLRSGNWAAGSTYKTNKNVFARMFSGAEDTLLQQTDQKFFQDRLEDSAGNARTKKGNAGRVNTFLGWAHQKGYLKERHKVEITMHQVIELRNTDSVKYITWQQLRDVCAAHRFIHRQNTAIYKNPGKDPEFYTDMWWFIFYSLLRKEEVPKLKVKDLARGRLKVKGKGRRTDTINLPPPALTIAEKYAAGKAKDDHLFTSHMNRAEHHLQRAVDMALGDEAVSYGFHQLRHGGVVHYITLGKAVQFISKLARHRSIQVTLTVYADILDEGMQEAFSDITHAPATGQRREVTEQRLSGMN